MQLCTHALPHPTRCHCAFMPPPPRCRRVESVASRLLAAGLISDAAPAADVFTRLALLEKQFKEAK